MLLAQVDPQNCAAVAVDCLNTFVKADGQLSISAFQQAAKGLDQDKIQGELDDMSKRAGVLRNFLFESKVPQIQFQDAHVIESIHGRRYHSLEIVREGEEPDFLRTFPPHALLDQNRRYGTPDQEAIEEIWIPKSKKIFIRWFEKFYPSEAILSPETELIFMKDDFCMSPGSPFVDRLFWELRRQGRFYLFVFGVCDEVCNLRNTLLLLSSIFNVIYVEDCTYPLDPDKREPAIEYMRNFNPLGAGFTGQFMTTTSSEVIQHFQNL